MRKILNVKNILLTLGLIILIIIGNQLFINFTQKPVKMIELQSIWTDTEIQTSNLTTKSIVTWDNNRLRMFNFTGEITEEVIGNGFFTNIYYFGDDIAVLDKQLNVLYTYNSTGDLKGKTQLTGNVYSIFKKGSDIYLHKKEDLTSQRLETITKLEGDGKESPVYQTDKFIVNFQIEGSELLVSEIAAENYAYKSTLHVIKGGKTNTYDFGNETILDMKKYGNKIIAVSNKNIYSLQDTKREKVELNKFQDYVFENNRIGILHNNRLVFFNQNLVEREAFDLGITTTGLILHDGGYFVYGPTDMVGYIGQKRQFKKTFDSIVYGVSSNDRTLLITHKYNVELYGFEVIEEGTN
jgi:hypothetical protein